MSLLGHDSQTERDDAAKGESLTRGTSHIVIAAIAATVVVTIVIAIYVLTGQKPPVATAQIIYIWAHPMHEVTPAFDASGSSISQDTFDQVLVFTHVRLHNQSKGPIFLHQILTNVTLKDGSVDSSYAGTASQYRRTFQAYPDLKPWYSPPIDTDLTIEAGETKEGTFVSSFRLPKEQWDARKELDFTFGFRYQPAVKAAATSAAINR